MNYIKKIHLEIENKIVKITKLNILIIYYKTSYATKEIAKVSKFIDETLKI